MERLTIIVPYYNRPEALSRLQKHLDTLSPEFFDIIISEVPTESSGKFNTAKAFNQGVEGAKTEWVMKNDVDCIPEKPELYQWVHASIQNMDTRNFMILGAKYLDQNGNLSKFHQCGNEVVCSKTAWEKVGRVPEWEGYGFEDYLFEYQLMNNLQPESVKLSDCQTPREMTNKFRDEYLKPENEKHEHWFLHHWHKPVFVREMVMKNHQKFFDEIRRIERG